jgi:hypothetical protein
MAFYSLLHAREWGVHPSIGGGVGLLHVVDRVVNDLVDEALVRVHRHVLDVRVELGGREGKVVGTKKARRERRKCMRHGKRSRA